MTSVLELENLEVVYHHVATAIQGVSLRVPPRSIVALLGTNGAGKTTTLRAISGFLGADDAQIVGGRVVFLGEAVTGRPPHTLARRGLVLVPERDKVFETLTVRENLEVARRGTGRWSLEQVYALFPRLRERAANRANKLSGGEQQMLAIGRALMSNPELLLLDEPTEGLAPLLVREVGRVIAELKRSGLSILLVEQNLALALSVADRVHVLSRGQIVHSGTPGELMSNDDVKTRYLGVA